MTAGPGHNSIARDRLRSFIERVERLQEERDAINADMKEVFAEAKGTGFAPKLMREVIRIRAMDPNDRAEQQFLLDVYLEALGLALKPKG